MIVKIKKVPYTTKGTPEHMIDYKIVETKPSSKYNMDTSPAGTLSEWKRWAKKNGHTIKVVK